MFRIREGYLDVVLVVTEPTLKSMETAERVLAMADRLGIEAVVIANRLRSADDLELIETRFDSREIFSVPHDDAVEDADRLGVAPIDHAPTSPGVEAVRALASSWTS